MHADRELLPYLEPLLADLGSDVKLIDIHTHVGLDDPAGLLTRDAELIDALELIDAHGVVFPLKEPDGYRTANERVLRLVKESEGRLSAFCRIDPADDPLGEAERSLDAGAVGIKLHPRGEAFEIKDKRLDPIFALADERRLPIMIHDGVGVEDVARDLLERMDDYPNARPILAHCAILCLSWFHREVPNYPNLLIDTSWWSPVDLMAVFHTVPSGQILYSSDVPFSHPTEAAIKTIRCARQAGYSDEEVRSVLGGQSERLLRGEDLLPQGKIHSDLGPPPSPPVERVCAYLLAACEGMLRGEEPGQGLELAFAASQVPEDDPNAAVLAGVRDLIELAQEQEEPDPLRHQRTPGFDIAIIAATVARTPAVPVPQRERAGA